MSLIFDPTILKQLVYKSSAAMAYLFQGIFCSDWKKPQWYWKAAVDLGKYD